MELNFNPESKCAIVEAEKQPENSFTKDYFKNIVALAAQVCETPVSAILFSSDGNLKTEAAYGIAEAEITWFIPPVIDELVFIPDTLKDSRFTPCSCVEKQPLIRFYVAVSLNTPPGFAPAQLCIMDYEPRSLTNKQLKCLQLLGNQASAIYNLSSKKLYSVKHDYDFYDSEEEINAIFHNAIDAVIVMDLKGIILQWNPKAETMFGWTRNEMIGKPFHKNILPKCYHEKHLEIVRNYEQETDHAHISNKTIEIRAFHKDHSEFDIALGISPATIKGRRFCICYISDITARKQVTHQLDKQKEFYENILNKLPTDIAVFNADHQYLFVNPGAISVKEYRNFIIGKDDYQYAEYRNRSPATADKRRTQFLEVKNTGKEIRWEDSLKDPNGNTITHLRRMYPVNDENGELSMVIGFGIDITDRKIMEEKQARLVEKLSAQNNQLVDFCNIVSHNLRAPLVNMSMLVQFIEESQDESEQNLLISKLSPVIQNLHTTFNELVESIQIKQDLEIKSEFIDLNDCLDRTVKGLMTEVNKLNAVIQVDFDEAAAIYFPPKYLHSIFHNLISNALKYHSPKRQPVITLKSKKLDGKILFSITDNGLGVDLAKHKDNFFKIGKVFHRHPNAKGFGLYMTKTQVEAMNSKIWVESIPDQGSTFFIEFTNQPA